MINDKACKGCKEIYNNEETDINIPKKFTYSHSLKSKSKICVCMTLELR